MSKIENLKEFLKKMHVLDDCYDNDLKTKKITQKYVTIKKYILKKTI
jgi:hypothetical protein